MVDCNYHAVALGGFNGRCAKVSSPSFLNISRAYFENEARHSFIGEAAFFAMMVATSGMSIVSGAIAVVHLYRVFGAL